MATIHPVKKFLWKILGFASLGMAYVGLITPGIPYSCFIVFAAYCFAKEAQRCMPGYIITRSLAHS